MEQPRNAKEAEDNWLSIIVLSHSQFCECSFGWREHLRLLCGFRPDGTGKGTGGAGSAAATGGEATDAALCAAAEAAERYVAGHGFCARLNRAFAATVASVAGGQ